MFQYDIRLKSLLGLMMICALACPAISAHAQDIELYTPEKEFDPDGWNKPPIEFGGFLLFSEAEIIQRYIDNVYARETNTESDFATLFRPKAELVKPFGRHRAAISATADVRKYYKLEDEDQINFITALKLDLEARHNLVLPIKLIHSQEHINRADSSRINAYTREPVAVTNNQAVIGANYNLNRLELGLLGTYWQRRIPDGDTTLGTAGVTAIGKDRERDTIKIEAEAAYETTTDWKPLVRLEYVSDKYKRRKLTANGFTGANQDNQKFRALAGFSYDYKDLAGVSALLGVENRRYDEPGTSSISGFTADVGLNLKPTERSSVKFRYLRTNNDDNLLLTGVRQNAFETLYNQELTSRLDAQLGLEYRTTDYLTLNREDKDFQFTSSLIYKLHRGLFLEGGYTYNTRDSSDPGSSYDQNVFMLGLKHQF